MEVHIDRIELLQGHDHRARAQISTGIDRDDTGPAGERCAQLLLRHIDLLLRHRRLLGLEIRGGLVVIGLADHLHRELLLRASEGELGERGGRLELMQQGDVFAVTQLQQHLTLLHLLARAHVDAGHEPGDIQCEIGAAHGAQGPHRAQLGLPVLIGGLRGADHSGRRRLARGDHLHDRQHLDSRDRGDQREHGDNHDNHALGGARFFFYARLHARLSCLRVDVNGRAPNEVGVIFEAAAELFGGGQMWRARRRRRRA